MHYYNIVLERVIVKRTSEFRDARASSFPSLSFSPSDAAAQFFHRRPASRDAWATSASEHPPPAPHLVAVGGVTRRPLARASAVYTVHAERLLRHTVSDGRRGKGAHVNRSLEQRYRRRRRRSARVSPTRCCRSPPVTGCQLVERTRPWTFATRGVRNTTAHGGFDVFSFFRFSPFSSAL